MKSKCDNLWLFPNDIRANNNVTGDRLSVAFTGALFTDRNPNRTGTERKRLRAALQFALPV